MICEETRWGAAITGVTPDIPVPVMLPHAKLPSPREMKDAVTSKEAIIMSVEEAEKIP